MFLLNLPSFAGENSLDALLFLVFETLHCHIWGVTFMDCSVDLRTQKSKELDRAGTNVLTNIRTTKEKHSNSEFFGQCYVWPIFFCFSFWFVFAIIFWCPKITGNHSETVLLVLIWCVSSLFDHSKLVQSTVDLYTSALNLTFTHSHSYRCTLGQLTVVQRLAKRYFDMHTRGAGD